MFLVDTVVVGVCLSRSDLFAAGLLAPRWPSRATLAQSLIAVRSPWTNQVSGVRGSNDRLGLAQSILRDPGHIPNAFRPTADVPEGARAGLRN